MMLPDSQQRLVKALDDLKSFVGMLGEVEGEVEELKEALTVMESQ